MQLSNLHASSPSSQSSIDREENRVFLSLFVFSYLAPSGCVFPIYIDSAISNDSPICVLSFCTHRSLFQANWWNIENIPEAFSFRKWTGSLFPPTQISFFVDRRFFLRHKNTDSMYLFTHAYVSGIETILRDFPSLVEENEKRREPRERRVIIFIREEKRNSDWT